jgi:selenocysteine-specific elongation factor
MTADAPQTITLTVGTAGHIDHGKTELVKYLTGCSTDVLPEEKERGMTINIGFATCELPNHRRVGIVDVPGHERFIHNMVAGAAGIDVVIMVVAADDGVMPQTIEHFHILRMLGVSAGMIVITKSDLADEARIEDVRFQIEALIADSFLADCPIIPFSAKTGAGFEEFHRTFVSIVDKTAERHSDGPFRLHVERSFILQGRGTIISGIPCSGMVKLGDELELLPEVKKTTVRGIQVYGDNSEEALTGECVALKMSDISKSNPERGMVLAEPGFFTPTQFINAKFQYLPHIDRPLKPRTAIRFHIGTTDIPGHIVLPKLSPLKPGEESYVQFQLKSPAVAAPGDFFVVRLLSPATTIGGGYVVAPVNTKLRRSRDDWQNECIEREEAFKAPDTALKYILANAEHEPMDLRQIAHLAFMNEASAKKHLGTLHKHGDAIKLPGDRYIWHQHLLDVADNIVSSLNKLHDEKPLSTGFEKKDLVPLVKANKLLFEKTLSDLINADTVTSSDTGLALKERSTALTPKQTELADRIEKLYHKGEFSTVRPFDLAEIFAMPDKLVQPVFDHLVQTGVLIAAPDNIVFHRDHVNTAKDMLEKYIESCGSIESGAFRDLIETTRKYSIPLLEYFDSIKLTIRKGNERTLRRTNG